MVGRFFSPSQPVPLPLLTLTSVLALTLLATCGRTELNPDEPCLPTDTTRPCAGACAEGVQQCAGGLWGRCQIPIVTRGCSSACGPGKEACVDGTWGACDAPQPKPPRLRAGDTVAIVANTSSGVMPFS